MLKILEQQDPVATSRGGREYVVADPAKRVHLLLATKEHHSISSMARCTVAATPTTPISYRV